MLRRDIGVVKKPTGESKINNDLDMMSRSTLNPKHRTRIPSPPNEKHGRHDKDLNNQSVAKTRNTDNVVGGKKEHTEFKFASRKTSPGQMKIQSQEVSSMSSNIDREMDHHKYEQEQEFTVKTSVIQKQEVSPRQSTSQADQIMYDPQQSLSPKFSQHNNSNVRNASKSNHENTSKSLLISISEKLQQNIQQIENKIDSSHKDTEQNLLNRNSSFYSKLEQGIADIRNQHEDDSQKLQSVAHKIDDIMKSMMGHFKLESDKLTQKQLELTTLQATVVEERKLMKKELDDERGALVEKYKLLSSQNEIAYSENKKEKEGLEHSKETLYQRESELSSKQEEHRSMMIKEQSKIEIQEAKMMIQEEKVDVKTIELQQKSYIISKQFEENELSSQKIDQERIKLQSMAEHLSQLSHELMMKSNHVDEKIARIEKMNSNIEQTRVMIMNEKITLHNDRFSVMSSVEEINVMKMDIARQRVEYLKEKFKK